MDIDGAWEQVADGVHAFLGTGGMPNAVCVIGGESAVVIDTLFTPRHARQMRAAFRETTDLPLLAVVNTHFHGDHIFGNAEFEVDRVIAHTFTREHLARSGSDYVELLGRIRPDLAPEWPADVIRLPTEVITDRLVLDLGGLHVHLLHHGRTAHTGGDLVAVIPERRVLVASDLVFNGIVPVMRDGDLRGLEATLGELRDDESYDVVVPGHGGLGGRELVETQRAFAARLLEICGQAGNPADAERAAFDDFGDLMFADERLTGGVERTFSQLRSTG